MIDSVFDTSTIMVDPSASGKIVQAHSVLRGLDGGVLVVDASEADLKVLDSHGSLERTVGRRGGGPGEFRYPAQAAWLSGDRLAVFDFGNQRIHFFNRNLQVDTSIGEFGRRTLHELEFQRGDTLYFGALSGGYALYGVLPWKGIVDSLILHPNAPVSSHPEAPLWNALSGWYAVSAGDSVYVMSSLSDSLWVVDWRTRQFQRRRLDLEGYRPPGPLPSGPIMSPEALRRWTGDFDVIGGMELLSGSLMVWYSSEPIYGEPEATLVIIPPTGPSRAFRAPFYPVGRDAKVLSVLVKRPATGTSPGAILELRGLK